MSSTPVSNSAKIEPATSNVQINGDRAPSNSSTITTTAKSSVTTVTASAKKSRKSEGNHTDGSTNYLPIAPHQTFFSPNQGLTLASASLYQSQVSGGVPLFTSSPMMTTLGTGPQGTVQQSGTQHATQQLVLAAGQPMGSPFNTANGQGQLIQNVLGGMPSMQVIQNGQTYLQPQFYANPGMQPMILTPNGIMTFQQNPTQNLAIQIPNNGNTMLTTNHIAASTPTTPVKGQQNQSMLKSITISPQQPQATKSSANATPTTARGQGQVSQQQQTSTVMQQATFQTAGASNQTFAVLNFQQGSANNQSAGATILPNTPTNNRKTTSAARFNESSNHKASNANVIQRIQPATSTLSTSPAQFKSNTSPFQSTQNVTSPANGQTIMVNGQGIQTGGFQLAPNQTILSSFNPIYQQPQIQGLYQGPNGQLYFRQSNDQSPILISTNNQTFQMPMQMAHGAQQATHPGTIQMTPTGQPLVTSSINQSLPIMQTNSAMTPTAIVTQQPNITPANNLLTSAASTQANMSAAVSTPVSNMNRQRTLLPAGNQSTNSTASKQKLQKLSVGGNTGTTSVGNGPKLAPKGSSAVSTGMQVNTLPRTSLGPQSANFAHSAPKSLEGQNLTSKASTSSTSTAMATATPNAKPAQSKVSSTSTATQSTVSTSTIPFTFVSTVPTLSSNTVNANMSSLVANSTGAQSIPSNGLKQNRKIEKNGIDSKQNILSVSNKTVKGNVIPPVRNNSNSGLNKSASATMAFINGVPAFQTPTNPHTKTTMGNGFVGKSQLPNGTVSKTQQTATNMGKNLSTQKPKPKQPGSNVLTHVIDDYVILESPAPFPINGLPEVKTEKNVDAKSDTKENTQANKSCNGHMPKDGVTVNGISRNVGNNETVMKPKLINGFNDSADGKNFKKKVKKGPKMVPPLNGPLQGPQPIQSAAQIIAPAIGNPHLQPLMAMAAHPTIGLNTAAGAKRPVPIPPNPAIQEKRARMNSPVPIKHDSPQPNHRLSNGQSDANDLKPKTEVKTEAQQANNQSDGEGTLWLPPGGKEPNKWDVQEVFDFIHHLEGSTEIAEAFRNQEIDGQAMLLLKEEHVVNILNMKLGPALKISRKIKDLKAMFNDMPA